jgi:hypothetical protein
MRIGKQFLFKGKHIDDTSPADTECFNRQDKTKSQTSFEKRCIQPTHTHTHTQIYIYIGLMCTDIQINT